MTIINTEGKPHFATLDGLRGIAALSVVIMHWLEGLGFNSFGSSVLAVDFFFMLSGFVVAFSYEDRLRKGFSFFKFMLLRVIRLHPMIILGTLLGFIRFQSKALISTEELSFDLVFKLISTTLMIPDINVLNLHAAVDINNEHFMINNALWSLFYEFFAYVLFGVLLFRIGKLTLTAVSALSLVGICYWINTSFGVNAEGKIIVAYGYFRLIFSFSLGILLFRCRDIIRDIGKKIPLYCLIILPLFFALPRNVLPWYFYLSGMLFIFPLGMIVGMNTKLEGTLSKVSDFLGNISYPIYAIHVPIIWGMAFALKKAGVEDPHKLVWFGLIVIPITIVLSYIALKIYDEPVRHWLKKKLLA